MFVDAILRQAGGRYFDDDGRNVFGSDINAHTLATLVSWCVGPDRMCADANEANVSGHRMRLDGTVLCSVIPDWMTSQWKKENPGLSGKLKLMPIPAFEPGGRRTTVIGGTMLAISKSTKDFDAAWAFAKELYRSPEVTETTFRGTGIISPFRSLWNLPFYDEPDPFFCGQPMGRLFINEAPNVPGRSSSPFVQMAMEKAMGVATSLLGYAEREGKYTPAELLPEAKRLLMDVQAQIQSHMDRNVFLEE